MIDFLEEIDRQIVLAINGLHSPWLDELMWCISARITWIPLYLVLFFLAFKTLDRRLFLVFIGLTLMSVALSDLVSVHFFKNVFLRYRPSHHLDLGKRLHYYQIRPNEFYKGGMYGFVSSHAANFFAIVTACWYALSNRFPKMVYIMIASGLLIMFSRVYLGVHYLSDTFVGALLGICVASIIFRLFYVPLKNKKHV